MMMEFFISPPNRQLQDTVSVAFLVVPEPCVSFSANGIEHQSQGPLKPAHIVFSYCTVADSKLSLLSG